MKFLSERPELKQAALIANKFKLDPWDVLNSGYFQWAIRLAAFSHISSLEEKEAEKMKSQSRKKH